DGSRLRHPSHVQRHGRQQQRDGHADGRSPRHGSARPRTPFLDVTPTLGAAGYDTPAALAVRAACAAPSVHGWPCPGATTPAETRSIASRERNAWPESRLKPEGMICGPSRPVSGFQVTSTSPVNKIFRLSTRIAALPEVWPGACTTRGRPGTPITSPSEYSETSWI